MRHLWLLPLLVLALALGWRFSHPAPLPAVPAAAAQGDEWHAVDIVQRQIPDVLERLEKHSPWGIKPTVVDAPALTPPDWHILGVVEAGANHFVLLQIEGQPVAQLQAGDLLPGGEKVLAVQQDSLCILLNGKARSLRIHRE